MWNLQQHRDRIAVITESDAEISYSELDGYASQLAARIGSRCLIFSLCTNTVGSLVGYVACLDHGIVPLMLDAKIDRLLLDGLLATYKPDFVWLPLAESERVDGAVVFSAHGYVLLKRGERQVHALNEELALLLTTSGSTGSPKLVRQSYTNIKSNTTSIVEYLGLDSSERPITTLPMNYTYGLSIINSHLWVGATIILTAATLMQREFWDKFGKHEATSFGGVPYTYEMLDKLRFLRKQLPTLRTMTQAGGKLQPELHEKFARYASENGKRFIVMYGQAEATARMSYLPAECSLEKCGSMGIAIPGGRLTLVNDVGEEISSPGEIGELVYYGDNVTLGYAVCGEDLSKGDERHGVLWTGDLARFDDDGYFYIVGRKKRFLKIFGNRVGLDETERMLKSEFSDVDCACVGRDDLMCIYITNPARKDDVLRFVSERTHINFSAFKIGVVDQLPKNESGKTLYGALDIIA